MVDDLIWKEAVFSSEEIQELLSISDKIGYHDVYGEDKHLFGKQLMISVANFPLDDEFAKWLKNKLQNYFTKDFIFHSMAMFKLYKPWDVHADWVRTNIQTGYVPYYNILISLDNVDSQTIVFDQYTSSSNLFSDYKEHNQKVSDPVPLDIWEKYLDYCWPHDREYLTIKQIMPKQTSGSLQAIPRKYFHASDNFHHRINNGKMFLQIRTDCLQE